MYTTHMTPTAAHAQNSSRPVIVLMNSIAHIICNAEQLHPLSDRKTYDTPGHTSASASALHVQHQLSTPLQPLFDKLAEQSRNLSYC